MKKKYILILFYIFFQKKSLSFSENVLGYLFIPMIYGLCTFIQHDQKKEKIHLPRSIKPFHEQYKFNFFDENTLPYLEDHLYFYQEKYVKQPKSYIAMAIAGTLNYYLPKHDIEHATFAVMMQGVLGLGIHSLYSLFGNSKKQNIDLDQFQPETSESFFVGSQFWKTYISQYIQFLYSEQQNKEYNKEISINKYNFKKMINLDRDITKIIFFLKKNPTFQLNQQYRNIINKYQNICQFNNKTSRETINNNIDLLLEPVKLSLSINTEYDNIQKIINNLEFFEIENIFDKSIPLLQNETDNLTELKKACQYIKNIILLINDIHLLPEYEELKIAYKKHQCIKKNFSANSAILDTLLQKEIKLKINLKNIENQNLRSMIRQNINNHTLEIKQNLLNIEEIKLIIDDIEKKIIELKNNYNKNLKIIISPYSGKINLEIPEPVSLYNYDKEGLLEHKKYLSEKEELNQKIISCLSLCHRDLEIIYKQGTEIINHFQDIQNYLIFKNYNIPYFLKDYQDIFLKLNSKYHCINFINLPESDLKNKMKELLNIFEDDDKKKFHLYKNELMTTEKLNTIFQTEINLLENFSKNIENRREDGEPIEINFMFSINECVNDIIKKLLSKIKQDYTEYLLLFQNKLYPTESTSIEKNNILSNKESSSIIFKNNLNELKNHYRSLEKYGEVINKYCNHQQIEYIEKEVLEAFESPARLIENFFSSKSKININIEEKNINKKILIIPKIIKLKNFFEKEKKKSLNFFSKCTTNHMSTLNALDPNYYNAKSEYNPESIEQSKKEIESIFNQNNPYCNIDLFKKYLNLQQKPNFSMKPLEEPLSKIYKNDDCLFLAEMKKIKILIIDTRNEKITKSIESMNHEKKAMQSKKISHIIELINKQNTDFDTLLNSSKDINNETLLEKIKNNNMTIERLFTEI